MYIAKIFPQPWNMHLLTAEEEVEQHIYLAEGCVVAMVEVAGEEGGVLMVDIQLLQAEGCVVAMVEVEVAGEEGGMLMVEFARYHTQ